MSEKTLGKLLEKNRKMRGISKTALCDGLCAIPALIRYEHDVRVPDKFLADALLERLGLSPFKYEFITSEEEFFFSMQRNKINNYIWEGEYKLAEKAIKEYQNKIISKQKLHVQYLLLAEAEIAIGKKKYQEASNILKEALSCTVSRKINENTNKNILLSDTEMKICYELAECLYLYGNEEESFQVFNEMKSYMDSVEWDNEKAKAYNPRILYRLSLQALIVHNFGLMDIYLSSAIELMIREYKLEYLHEILELYHVVCENLEKEYPYDNDDFVIALKMIAMSDKGRITEEGMHLWENTANQQL